MIDTARRRRLALGLLAMALLDGLHGLVPVNDVLDVSKIEAGRIEVECIEVQLAPLLAEVAELCSPRALGKGVALELVASGPLPVRIHTDPTRLRQILLNLVGNALKFTERGEVRVEVACDAAREALRISVVAAAFKMTEEQLDVVRAFAPFTQADTSMTRRFGGTGLGLRISHGLAALLGGGIEVTSTYGEGSTFTVLVTTGPLGQLQPMALARAKVATPQPAAVVEHRPDGVRILLAEDGPDNQRLISFHLRKAGATVLTVDNGRRAVDHVLGDGESADLVLMDMQMPVLDGYDATRQLRSAGFDGPIIALTAHAMAGDRDRCLQAGCSDYVRKPIDREVLLSTCHAWSTATA